MSKIRRPRKTRKQKDSSKPNPLRIAKHSNKFTVSCCMIVKNECLNIRKALATVSPIVDEIIIVDTGSTDGTQGICREFEKVKLYEPKPILFMTKEEDGFDRIDFGANRNVAQSHAKGDWIFVLDGDEYVGETDGIHHHIERLENHGVNYSVVDIIGQDLGGQSSFVQARLYKNDGKVKWAQPVHNCLKGLSEMAGRTPLQIHLSYKKEDRTKEKEDRSLPMLLKAAKEFPEESWPAFYLAGQYLSANEPEKTKLWARRALADDPKDINKARAWLWLVHATLMVDGLDESEKLLYQALILHPNYPDLGWTRTVYSLARWEICTTSASSNLYANNPQRTYSIDRAQVAKALGIPWPLVKAKQLDNGESNGNQRPTIGN